MDSADDSRGRRAIVSLNDDPLVAATHPSGLHFQICRATVDGPEASVRFALFLPLDFEAAAPAPDVLVALSAGEVAGTIGVLVRDPEPGRAAADVAPEHASHAFQIAAAVAVMRASWAWDESPTILVTVNAVPIAVVPRFEEYRWVAREDPAWHVPPRWELWRQDDNGNRVRISAFETEAAARLVLAQFEALHHKQIYWIEERGEGA